MRTGGAVAKGATWERVTGQKLSLWLTLNARRDLFSRNVLSGGRFTRAEKDGGLAGLPGDLMAAHPLAFGFLSNYLVECKHHKDLHLDRFLLDTPDGKSPLTVFARKAAEQAQRNSMTFMLIAKQNRIEPILITDTSTGTVIEFVTPTRHLHRTHRTHLGRYYVIPFFDFIQHCPVRQFMITLGLAPPTIARARATARRTSDAADR